MAYVAFKKSALNKTARAGSEASFAEIKSNLRHPVRVRVMSIMSDGRPRTQRELGRILSMSDAAVHYHLKALLDMALLKLHDTKEGPNGIVEKLYCADVARWKDVLASPDKEGDLDFYLAYAVAWMHERHREGVEMIRTGDNLLPFLVGSCTLNAPLSEIVKLKRDLAKLIERYQKKHEFEAAGGRATCAVTFALLPSQSEETPEESRNVLDYEP